MGKKKKDKRDFDRGLNSQFYGPGKKARKMLERYGVEGTRGGGRAMEMSGKSYRSTDDVKRDLAAAMMKDYHTNESFQNAALAGHKGAKKFAKKGFDSGNIYDAWDTYKDLKKEYVGGGGMMGAENIAGLTYETGKALRGFTAKEEKEESKPDVPTLDYYEAPDLPDDYKSEGEKAQERMDNYERTIAPSYFDLDGTAELSSNGYDDAIAFREGFKDRLKKAINSAKVG